MQISADKSKKSAVISIYLRPKGAIPTRYWGWLSSNVAGLLRYLVVLKQALVPLD